MRLLPLLLAPLVLFALPALAEITVKDAWVRATPATGRVTAGYAVIANTGGPDQLLAVKATGAEASIHRTVRSADGMAMEEVAALDIPPRGSVELAPAGTHVMITGLAKPLAIGETLKLTFTFKNAGDVSVPAKVAALGATEAPK